MLLGFAQILIFLSFPTYESERLPAVASQQIAETSFQRKTSFIRPTKTNHEIKISSKIKDYALYSKRLKYSSNLSFAIFERTKSLVDYFGLSLYIRGTLKQWGNSKVLRYTSP